MPPCSRLNTYQRQLLSNKKPGRMAEEQGEKIVRNCLNCGKRFITISPFLRLCIAHRKGDVQVKE